MLKNTGDDENITRARNSKGFSSLIQLVIVRIFDAFGTGSKHLLSGSAEDFQAESTGVISWDGV